MLKFQLPVDNLVDLKNCWKMRIHLQKPVPIQPKTSKMLPKNWQMCGKFCQSWQKLAVEEASRARSKTPRRTAGAVLRPRASPGAAWRRWAPRTRPRSRPGRRPGRGGPVTIKFKGWILKWTKEARSRLYRSQFLQVNTRWNSYLFRKED